MDFILYYRNTNVLL